MEKARTKLNVTIYLVLFHLLNIFQIFTDEQNGECFISETEVNPLNLTARPGTLEPPLANLEMSPFTGHRFTSEKLRSEKHNSTNNVKFSSTSTLNQVRKRRDVNDAFAEAFISDKDGRPKVVKVIVSITII